MTHLLTSIKSIMLPKWCIEYWKSLNINATSGNCDAKPILYFFSNMTKTMPKICKMIHNQWKTINDAKFITMFQNMTLYQCNFKILSHLMLLEWHN